VGEDSVGQDGVGEDGMDEGRKHDDKPDAEGAWQVDVPASFARAREEAAGDHPREAGGGKLTYIDEHGNRRHLPADMSELTRQEVRAATGALSSALGGASPDYARIAAIERLTELRASGAVSEENFNREKRRLMGYG